MGIELSDLLSERRWIEVEIDDNKINVAYNPNRITNRRMAELTQLQAALKRNDSEVSEEEALYTTIKLFCDVVVEWDIMHKGEPYPIEFKALQDFPSAIMNRIWAALRNDIDTGEEEKKASNENSAVGLPREATPANAQNGTRSSARRGSFRSRRGT